MLGAALLAVLLTWPQDSVRVQASLTADRITVGATTILAIQVETSGAAPDEIPVPVLAPGLELGPISDFSQVEASFPGGRRRITRREIVLQGVTPGVYRIPAIAIRVAGRTARTSPLQLAVDPAPSGRSRPGAGGVVVRAWVSPATVFSGEQVLYRVEAVFPEELRLRQTRPADFEPPVAPGFWTYDLPQPVTASLRMTSGQAAEVQEFRQVLFPLNAGELVIPPARLQYELRQGIVFTPEVHTLATDSVRVHVRPLPAGAPPTFAGAVGSYAIRSDLSTLRALPGEPVTFGITIEGSGNIKALARPALDTVPGMETFPGGEHVEVGFADGGVSGRKRFEWTLVGRAAGSHVVPPIEFSWFDPVQRSYRVARTAPLTLTIAGAAANLPGEQALEPLRTEPGRAGREVTRTPAFLAAQLLPPIALAGWWLAQRRRKRRAETSSAAELRELELAAALADDPRACLEQLGRWLGKRGESAAVRDLRSAVRQALYAPVSPTRGVCEELLRAARALAAHPDARRGRRLNMIVLAAAIAGLPAGSAAFSRGVTAYQAGSYAEAAAAFATHIRTFPADQAAWYDLGNSAYLAGQPGRAAWAWLKALELQPRDQRARNNLLRTGAYDAERSLAPRVGLANREAALAAALCWWLAAACFGLALASRRWHRAGTFSGTVLLLLMVPLLVLLIARTAAAPKGVTLVSATLQSAPSLRADTLRTLAPGAPVSLSERRGDWLLVRSRDLRQGWVESGSVGLL